MYLVMGVSYQGADMAIRGESIYFYMFEEFMDLDVSDQGSDTDLRG